MAVRTAHCRTARCLPQPTVPFPTWTSLESSQPIDSGDSPPCWMPHKGCPSPGERRTFLKDDLEARKGPPLPRGAGRPPTATGFSQQAQHSEPILLPTIWSHGSLTVSSHSPLCMYALPPLQNTNFSGSRLQIAHHPQPFCQVKAAGPPPSRLTSLCRPLYKSHLTHASQLCSTPSPVSRRTASAACASSDPAAAAACSHPTADASSCPM